MNELLFPALLGLGAVAAALVSYAIARTVQRKRRAAALRAPRPWQPGTLEAWVERGWLDPARVDALPREISPARVLYEWARTDPEVVTHWQITQPLVPETPVEAIVRELWSRLPEAVAITARARLSEALGRASAVWGGAEHGWNGRPLALLASALSKKGRTLPLVGLDDLTAAPLPALTQGSTMAAQADGPDLLLALAALQRAAPAFLHPLAPRQGARESLVSGLSTQIGTDVGRKIGAGLGAALGPIGSLVGQHLGGMMGALGGKALAQQALPDHLVAALKETERALRDLGELAATTDFERAASLPVAAILEMGKQVESRRSRRAAGFRERIWPSQGLSLIEESLLAAVGELKGFRGAADQFVAAARKSDPAVAGGMILQNPWLVRALPGGVERLNAARAALNAAAALMRRS